MKLFLALITDTVRAAFHAALYLLLTAGLGAWLWGCGVKDETLYALIRGRRRRQIRSDKLWRDLDDKTRAAIMERVRGDTFIDLRGIPGGAALMGKVTK